MSRSMARTRPLRPTCEHSHRVIEPPPPPTSRHDHPGPTPRARSRRTVPGSKASSSRQSRRRASSHELSKTYRDPRSRRSSLPATTSGRGPPEPPLKGLGDKDTPPAVTTRRAERGWSRTNSLVYPAKPLACSENKARVPRTTTRLASTVSDNRLATVETLRAGDAGKLPYQYGFPLGSNLLAPARALPDQRSLRGAEHGRWRTLTQLLNRNSTSSPRRSSTSSASWRFRTSWGSASRISSATRRASTTTGSSRGIRPSLRSENPA